MQYMRKALSILSGITLFISNVTLAQKVIYIPPSNTISGMIYRHKAQKLYDEQFKMGQMMPNSVIGIDFHHDQPYGFEILLKDNTKQKGYVSIQFDSVSRKSYLVLINKKFPKSDPEHREQKIYPDQTIQISRVNYFDKAITGIAKDSCRMFKVISGPINAYSYLSEESGPTFDEDTMIGIQLNDGPILVYSVENLKQMVGQDVDALESIEKKDYYKAIIKYNRNNARKSKK